MNVANKVLPKFSNANPCLGICNQNPNPVRASNIVIQNNPLVTNTSNALFKRWCSDLPKLVSDLIKCTLASKYSIQSMLQKYLYLDFRIPLHNIVMKLQSLLSIQSTAKKKIDNPSKLHASITPTGEEKPILKAQNDRIMKPLEGYHLVMEKLTPEEIEPHLRYIAQSGYAHTPKCSLIGPFGYQPVDPKSIEIDMSAPLDKIEILEGSFKCNKNAELIKTEKCFADKNTGLKILVSEHANNKEIVLAFGDLSSLEIELKETSKKIWHRQTKAVLCNLGGLVPELYTQAESLAVQIIKKMSENLDYKYYTFTLVGQSLGGSLAQFVGLRNEIKTMCYNAVPLGPGLQKLIGNEKLKKADKHVIHVTAESDMASDLQGVGIFDSILSSLKVCTPGNFGQRYSIPSAYQKMQETHSFVLGSAMHHLNLNKRTTPQDLVTSHPNLLKTVQERLDERLKEFMPKCNKLLNFYERTDGSFIRNTFIQSEKFQKALKRMAIRISFSLTHSSIHNKYRTFKKSVIEANEIFLNNLKDKDQFITSLEYKNSTRNLLFLTQNLKAIYDTYLTRVQADFEKKYASKILHLSIASKGCLNTSNEQLKFKEIFYNCSLCLFYSFILILFFAIYISLSDLFV